MAYRIQLHHSLSAEIKRIINDELDSAVEGLTKAAKGNHDKAVHEARKSVKKIRGALRLVQDQMGASFRTENHRLRDVGRQLSDLRDGSAILETFDDLVKRHEATLKPNADRPVRTGLKQSKQKHEADVHVDELLQKMAGSLTAASKHVQSWPLKRKDFQLIASGFEETYRRGRKLMAATQSNPSAQAYHEWRKQVKAHWYHVRLLENLWVQVMQAHQESLKEIETALGDDHNLTMLVEKLQAAPDEYGGEETVQVFVALARADQQVLREQAISLGQQVYDEKPVRFRKYMHRLWDVSQAKNRSTEGNREVTAI